MNSITKILKNLPVAIRATTTVLLEPRKMAVFAGLFFLIVVLLQWLFQPANFWNIVTNSALSVTDRIDTIIQAFFDVFQFIDDLTPISFILIALFQSAAIATLLKLRDLSKKQSSRKQLAALGLGLVGSGCVACGGSVLTPLLGAVATSLSVAAAQAVGDVVLIAAVAYSAYSWHKIAIQYASVTRMIR